MNLEELKREIPYKMKEGFVNKKTGKKGPDMAYIDARQVSDLLDEVVGPENWQCDYKDIKGNLFCGIGIWIEGRWVFKWDTGDQPHISPDKGEASDAFKRAAVKWGVGRFLYSIKPGSGRKTITPPEDAGKKMNGMATQGQKGEIWKLAKAAGFTKKSLSDFVNFRCDCALEDMTNEDACKILAGLRDLQKDGVRV